MKTLKTVSTVLAVLIMALALPLLSCSSEPKADPQASAESKPISQEELDALRDKADKRTLTQKEREILREAERKIAREEEAETRALIEDEHNKRRLNGDNKEDQGKTP